MRPRRLPATVGALVACALVWITGCGELPDPAEPPDGFDPPAAAAPRPGGTATGGAVRPSEESASARSRKEPRSPAGTSPSDVPPPTGERPSVLYLGDSIGMETQTVLRERIESDGRAKVHSVPYSGITLCDYLTDRPSLFVSPKDKAATLVRTHRPRVVVLQFWGNSWGYTPCMDKISQGSDRYFTRYTKDAETLTGQIASAARSAGIPRPRIVWVLQGPDAFSTDRTRRVNDLYRARAAASGDLLADAGRAVSPEGGRYEWRERLPCNAAERARPGFCRDGMAAMHRHGDALHFCMAPTTSTPRPCPAASPGIVRYTDVIASVVDRYLRGIR
ncbi:SGNH/GDSL hydrolase family protein (plasmid) [Streptomyces sp. CA-294286]|uniref:SGNH/GDSL hydrolase family protein n=1 Tax=Streptomyces sp. CA-294286 TaxID=3240070 RepID=UPI003D938EDF